MVGRFQWVVDACLHLQQLHCPVQQSPVHYAMIVPALPTNKVRPCWQINTMSQHAEENALQRVHYTNRCDIVVVRLSKNGQFGNSRPCTHCLYKMKHRRGLTVVDVYYSTSVGQLVCQRMTDLMQEAYQHVSTGHRKRKVKSSNSSYERSKVRIKAGRVAPQHMV